MKKILFSALLLLSFGSAQTLADLLPAETFLAFGTQDLAQQQDKLEPFIAEFNRLELTQALAAVFASSETSSTEMPEASLPAELEGLAVLDILGQEAWMAVSASRFNPLPAVTLVASLTDSASSQFDALLANTVTQEGISEQTEGSLSFYQQSLELENMPPQVLSFAKQNSTLLFSSNPDVMRGMLRQLQGSQDPSFSSSTGFASTLAQFENSSFLAYFDYAQLPAAVATYIRGLGFDKLIERLTDALETAGVSGGALRFTDSGLESVGIQAVNVNGKDKQLLALLTNDVAADPATQRFFSQDALSFSTQAVDLAAWWAYLNDISKSTPELGGSLEELIELFVGINLQETVFSWTGQNFASVTTALSETAQPGVASDNLLGEQVFILEVTDEAKAQEGLTTLLTLAGGSVAALANPSGQSGAAGITTEQLNGIDVYSFEVSPGIQLKYTFVNGYAVIATSAEALNTVLSASANPLTGSSFAGLPEGINSYSTIDNRRSLESSASQIVSQLQMTAGFGGASTLNFDAVDEASAKLTEFMQFVAQRFGNSVSYSQKTNEGIYSFGQTDVSW